MVTYNIDGKSFQQKEGKNTPPTYVIRNEGGIQTRLSFIRMTEAGNLDSFLNSVALFVYAIVASSLLEDASF